MDIFQFVFVMIALHCAIYFIHTIFTTCSHHPYTYFLQNTGLQIDFLRVQWFTCAFNKWIHTLGSMKPKLLNVWFTVGSWLSLALLPITIYLVIQSTYAMLPRSENIASPTPIVMMEPVVPGVTFPLEDLGYYIATLAICSIFHELGHALAAVRERVRVFGVGVAIFVVLPMAYVQLSTTQLQSLSPGRQLQITTAGVWHNTVLSGLAVIVTGFVPFLFAPLYSTNLGVSVTKVVSGSSLDGSTGLSYADHLLSLDECHLTDKNSWPHCIQALIKQDNLGYCTSTEMEPSQGINKDQCCPESLANYLCFQQLSTRHRFCLRARAVVENASSTCSHASQCSGSQHCFVPVVDNSTKLVTIRRAHSSPVLFLGHPADIFHSVQVTTYVPRYSWISATIPDSVAQMCYLISTLSAGLGLVNLVPCFWFDGQYIMYALVHLLLAGVLSKQAREHIAFGLTLGGSLLLFISVAVSVYHTAIR